MFNPLVLVQLSVFVLPDYPWYYWCSGDGTTVLVTVTCALPTLLCHYLPCCQLAWGWGATFYFSVDQNEDKFVMKYLLDLFLKTSASPNRELSLMSVLVSAVILMTFPL